MSPRPSAKPSEKSAQKPADKPAEKTAAKPAAKATKKATGTTAKKTTGATAKKTTGATAKKTTGTTTKKASGTAAKKSTGAPAKKAVAKTPEVEAEVAVTAPAEHDHDHDGHDHDAGDHDGHDPELSEEEKAQAEADLEQMTRALAALDDNTLRGALAGMSEKSRQEVATHLQLPRATMHLGEALMPLVRRKLQTTAPEHQLQVLFALAQHANDQTVQLLGPRSEDPTRDDLLEVLPAVIEEHGVEIVTLMLAGYTASDAVCRPVMRDILEGDERFVIGEPVPVEAKPELGALPAPALDKAELEAKREQRRAAKDAKRAAEQREREARANAQAKRRQAVHEAKRKAR